MSWLKSEVGPCPICGQAHTACTAGTGPITVTMTPARDGEGPHVPLVAEVVQAGLPAGATTTGTYRGKNGGKK